jgi:hypothetical protein
VCRRLVKFSCFVKCDSNQSSLCFSLSNFQKEFNAEFIPDTLCSAFEILMFSSDTTMKKFLDAFLL